MIINNKLLQPKVYADTAPQNIFIRLFCY